ALPSLLASSFRSFRGASLGNTPFWRNDLSPQQVHLPPGSKPFGAYRLRAEGKFRLARAVKRLPSARRLSAPRSARPGALPFPGSLSARNRGDLGCCDDLPPAEADSLSEAQEGNPLGADEVVN